jgi:ABC-type sulfate transport system permease component
MCFAAADKLQAVSVPACMRNGLAGVTIAFLSVGATVGAVFLVASSTNFIRTDALSD